MNNALRSATALVSVVATILVSACATPWWQPLHGEQAAYHVFNATNDPVIARPELLDESRRVALYANLEAQRPGRQPYATSFQSAPGPHRVPNAVWVQWRELAAPGQLPDTGAFVGPIRVAIRDRIPPDVIARLQDSWRYQLEIAVGARESQPELFWRLRHTTDRGSDVVSRSINDPAR